MRKIILVLLACCAVAACGPSSTPLSRGLTAFREGDHEGLAAAGRDAEAEIASAIQPGADLCQATNVDVTKYNARYAIRKLDQESLFKLPEEDRLVYALKNVGTSAHIWPGSFLTGAPLFYETPDNRDSCPKERRTFMDKQFELRAYTMNDVDARGDVFETWIADMKRKYGDQYDNRMRSAARDLENNGYDGAWPVQF